MFVYPKALQFSEAYGDSEKTPKRGLFFAIQKRKKARRARLNFFKNQNNLHPVATHRTFAIP